MRKAGELSEREFREVSLNSDLLPLVFRLGAPLAFYSLFNAFFQLLDTMMASHVSSVALSSVSYLSQIQNLILSLGLGLVAGAAVVMSRSFGEGDFEGVRKSFGNLMVLLFFVMLLLLVMVPFVPFFLSLMGTPEVFIREGASYFQVLILSTVLNLFNNAYISVERIRGRTRRIMVLNFLVMAIKLSLTWFFVYILESTIVMIAVSTLISHLFLSVVALSFFRNAGSLFSLRVSFMKPERKTTGSILSLSFPLMFEKSAFSLGKTIVNSIISAFDPISVGALGVSTGISGLVTLMQSGFSDASTALISQNDGDGRSDRVVKCYFSVLILTLTVSLLGTVILFLFSRPLIHIFAMGRDGYDAAFENLILQVFRYDLFSCFPLAFNISAFSLIIGKGRTKTAFFISFCRVYLFRIPLLKYLLAYTSLGNEAVGIVMVVSNTLTAVLSSSIALSIVVRERRSHE